MGAGRRQPRAARLSPPRKRLRKLENPLSLREGGRRECSFKPTKEPIRFLIRVGFHGELNRSRPNLQEK